VITLITLLLIIIIVRESINFEYLLKLTGIRRMFAWVFWEDPRLTGLPTPLVLVAAAICRAASKSDEETFIYKVIILYYS
jgi:hypothetical protein